MNVAIPLMPRSGIRPGRLTSPEGRMATCVFSTGAKVTKAGEIHTLAMDGCDVSGFVGAPLLEQHDRHASAVLGIVEHARVESVAIAVVRFSRRPLADEYWSMVTDGMPLACSIGYDVLEAEPAPDHQPDAPSFRVLRWKPTEISIVAIGADDGARIRLPSLGDLVITEQERADRLERERAERLEALRADAWRAWASDTASASLAADLGVPAPWVGTRIGRLVDEHLSQLEDAVRVIAEARADL